MALHDIEGLPIWFELATPDPAAARTFYESVIGWRTGTSSHAEHGGYGLAYAADDDMVAGFMAPPPGAPGGWSVYFGTADLDAVLARATAAGGRTVFGPMDIPHVGRFAVLLDPQGVSVQVMQPDAEDDTRPFRQAADALGHAVWIELATPDPEGAFAFYEALFGWTKQGGMPMGEMGDYAFFGSATLTPGAIMSSTLTGAPARWNSYFLVADIDAALARAQAGGGSVAQGPDPIPGGDFSANIVDPAGHAVGLVGPRRTVG
ncbi:VOC family protein [Sphingomonas sp. VNH70]|uniref:VOC family protein n=1 Tax=Sphingomonas silueang TaxID=3156617 RepID=UPI0032B3E658